MYREIAGTDERVRAIPGVRDRRVRATKVRLYLEGGPLMWMMPMYINHKPNNMNGTNRDPELRLKNQILKQIGL